MESMDEIFQKHGKTVYRYLLSITGDSDLSDELTQETFYQAVKSIDRFDGSCKITTWLCAIAKNQLSSYRRKHPAMEEWENQDVTSDSTEEVVLEKMERIVLMKKLHAIEEPFREVMYLRLFGDLPFLEIGEIMGKTENWARVMFYRGKEKLRKEILGNEK